MVFCVSLRTSETYFPKQLELETLCSQRGYKMMCASFSRYSYCSLCRLKTVRRFLSQAS